MKASVNIESFMTVRFEEVSETLTFCGMSTVWGNRHLNGDYTNQCFEALSAIDSQKIVLIRFGKMTRYDCHCVSWISPRCLLFLQNSNGRKCSLQTSIICQ